MTKAFKYRIYPKKSQKSILRKALEGCRWVYNQFLEQRKTSWEDEQKPVSMYSQIKRLPQMKREKSELKGVHSQVLQNVATRIDLAFKAFFRRCKAGEKPGYPRFRGRSRYDSITYPQYGNGAKINPDGSLQLSKIGRVKMVYHRPIEGTPKTITIRRSATGKWYATITCEWEPTSLSPNDKQVGIDVGLNYFAVLSTGEHIDNPRFFRTEEKALAIAQRKLSKTEKGTTDYKKRLGVVSRIHERISFRRHNFIHQLSWYIVSLFGFIAVEDLNVNRMVHNHCLAKSISDAAWSMFFSALFYKAECAGRIHIAVNPAYTSQTCSRCGHRQKMTLDKRIYKCLCCQLEIDRDLNAAINILALGRQSESV
jgi:putative transposase